MDVEKSFADQLDGTQKRLQKNLKNEGNEE